MEPMSWWQSINDVIKEQLQESRVVHFLDRF